MIDLTYDGKLVRYKNGNDPLAKREGQSLEPDLERAIRGGLEALSNLKRIGGVGILEKRACFQAIDACWSGAQINKDVSFQQRLPELYLNLRRNKDGLSTEGETLLAAYQEAAAALGIDAEQVWQKQQAQKTVINPAEQAADNSWVRYMGRMIGRLRPRMPSNKSEPQNR